MARKKKKKNKDKLLIANANKIVPIQTKEHPNKLLLRMTGDKKRYGGGPSRYIKKA
mgnify:CR=1 FL=1